MGSWSRAARTQTVRARGPRHHGREPSKCPLSRRFVRCPAGKLARHLGADQGGPRRRAVAVPTRAVTCRDDSALPGGTYADRVGTLTMTFRVNCPNGRRPLPGRAQAEPDADPRPSAGGAGRSLSSAAPGLIDDLWLRPARPDLAAGSVTPLATPITRSVSVGAGRHPGAVGVGGPLRLATTPARTAGGGFTTAERRPAHGASCGVPAQPPLAVEPRAAERLREVADAAQAAGQRRTATAPSTAPGTSTATSEAPRIR